MGFLAKPDLLKCQGLAFWPLGFFQAVCPSWNQLLWILPSQQPYGVRFLLSHLMDNDTEVQRGSGFHLRQAMAGRRGCLTLSPSPLTQILGSLSRGAQA